MFHRTFEGNPPYITFTSGWEQSQFGDFRPGRTVHIAYDPYRLPAEEMAQEAGAALSITAFYRFAPNGPVQSKQLDRPAGPPPPHRPNDPVEAVPMTTTIDIPQNAVELALWFLDTGASGEQHWDSNFGANYVFRFTALDIQGEDAHLEDDPDNPAFARFSVLLTALPDVESPAVIYRVTNAPAETFNGSVPLVAGELANGRRAWSASGILVPAGAIVRFAFTYSVGGRTFVDNNDGTGFWAPKPLPTHNPRKFAQAMAERGMQA